MLFYFIGIKGSGMSALAKLLIDKGHIVLGVDVHDNLYTEKNLLYASVESFESMRLKKSYFYIIGNAYLNHRVTSYIKKMGYYNMTYPNFISRYFKDYFFISVSGSHGKTSATKMLSEMIKDCDYLIGDGTGFGGGDNVFVLESCEYKNTFLNYHPDLSLILNIDYDHPDFFKNEDEYIASFSKFAKQSKEVIINGDDLNYKKIEDNSYITYGIKPSNDIVFSYRVENNKSIVNIIGKNFTLNLFGLHYAYDFVGAYLCAKLLGASDDYIQNKMNSFKLPKRRMEEYSINNVVLIHDYAHHPSEINALNEAVRLKYPNKKIIAIFQPHTISRTARLLDKFKYSLSNFDDVYLLPIFTSVRESVNLNKEKELYDYLGYKKSSFKAIEELKKNDNYVYLFIGAGDIYNLFLKIKNDNI